MKICRSYGPRTEYFKDQSPEPRQLKHDLENDLSHEIEELTYDVNNTSKAKAENSIDKLRRETEEAIQKARSSNLVPAPFEHTDETGEPLFQEHETPNASETEASKSTFYIPEKQVDTGNLPITGFEDDPTDKKKDSEQGSGENNDEDTEGNDNGENKAIALTEAQEKTSTEELLQPTSEPGTLQSIYSWFPSIGPLLVTAAVTYGASWTAGSKTWTALAFLTTFTLTYIYDLFEVASHTPQYFIDRYGRANEVFETGAHSGRSLLATGRQEYSSVERVLSDVNLTELFVHFCNTFHAEEDQFHELLLSLHLAVLDVWSGITSLQTSETKEPDLKQLRERILRTAKATLIERSKRKKQKSGQLPLEEISGQEVATPAQVKKSIRRIVLTLTGETAELISSLERLAHGYYVLSDMRATLAVDRTAPEKPFILFFSMLKTEYHFIDATHLSNYLLHFRKKIIASPLSAEKLSQSAFGEDSQGISSEEAFDFMGFEMQNPPSMEDIKKKYYELAKKTHPDKNQENPDAHANFQKLQESKLKIEEYLREQSEND